MRNKEQGTIEDQARLVIPGSCEGGKTSQTSLVLIRGYGDDRGIPNRQGDHAEN